MNYQNISLFKPKMEYRRFGKTNKEISVITLGGMRFKHGWTEPRNNIPKDTLEQVIDTVQQAFAHGINHIETAWGYTKSETAYGKVLNQELNIPRNTYYLMTKGSPKTAAETRSLIEKQLNDLQTDYFDFYAWHGMNTMELVDLACASGGPVEELLKLKAEGVIKHVGFSTHAPLDAILKAISSNLFEFVNLHYYYTFQRNKPAVDLAASKDMGVFIISPNDKGGQLFNPPEKLKKFTTPISPLQWNARFCLGHKAIHTLTFGLPETASFNDLNGIFPAHAPMSEKDQDILQKLDAEIAKVPFADFDGYTLENDPSGINIPETLRFRKLLKAFDMDTFGYYRYNMLRENDPWYGGAFPTPERLRKIDLSKCPTHIPLIKMIKETHKKLYKAPKK
jgi:predicted aldo/keto reductase-like oxidoreductase